MLSGEALLYTANPFVAGAAAGLASNVMTQTLKNRDKNREFDVGSMVFDTMLGAATALIPGKPRFQGLNAGRGSALQVFNQMVTKAKNGTATTITTMTAAKMAGGAFYESAFLQGSFVGATGSTIYSNTDWASLFDVF